MSDEGYNVKDIIKRNIASARKDAAGLKRPRGPEGKPPEMGSGFMQKRKDAAAKIKAGRKELASQTENFITRTVGMLFDRLTEEMKPSLAQRAVAAAKKRPGATVTKTDAGREVVEAPPKNPKKQTTLLATDKKGGVTIDTGKKTRDLASHQFINRTVGILVDRIEELKHSTMQSAADKRDKQAQDLTKAAAAARSVGAKQTNADLAKVAGTATAGASRIKAGMRTREKGRTATKPSERIGRKEIAASNRKTRQSQERLGMRNPVPTPKKEATENFIGKTVEILAEKLIGNQHEIDADGDKKITKKDFKILKKRKDEAVKPDTSAYLAPSKPQNTPIDGRGVAKTPEEIAKQKAKDKAFSDKFRADIAKKFGR